MDFIMPPVMLNARGEVRKVGFELEFGGLELDAVSAIIQELFGGEIIKENRFLQKVKNSCLGTFQLKMDSRVLTEKRYEHLLDKFGIGPGNETIDGLMESLASIIIPYEIGTPPVPMSQIHQFERLRQALHEHEAEGTRRSLFTAFATHINAEVPDTDVPTILNYIKAFLLLYPWMFEQSKIYITRRLSNYIKPFPEDYTRLVLQPGYNPGLEVLIDDYYRFNPDRNRPLDMYPVFSLMSPAQVKQLGDLGNVKPRPTFHYRLPNSLVDEADWSLADEWDTWLKVEQLANQPEAIQKLSREYLDKEESTFMNFNSKWADRIEEWLNAAL